MAFGKIKFYMIVTSFISTQKKIQIKKEDALKSILNRYLDTTFPVLLKFVPIFFVAYEVLD